MFGDQYFIKKGKTSFMNKAVILTIIVYQKIISPLIKNVLGIKNSCRFNPSCSEYTKQSILKYGLIKGCRLSLFRFLKCRP